MKRILIVDDHPIVRDGLKQILGDTDDLVVGGEAGNADEALSLVRDSDFDLVVLDITLPGRTGIDLLRDLRRERPALPVLMLSIHPEDELGIRAVKAGASGFLSKACASDDLEPLRTLPPDGMRKAPEDRLRPPQRAFQKFVY